MSFNHGMKTSNGLGDRGDYFDIDSGGVSHELLACCHLVLERNV